MSDLNQVVLVGRLVRDPELRYTPQGAAVSEFTLASNRRFTKADGEKVEEVIFVDTVAWNKLAEVTAEFLKKGRMVALSGSLTQERWEDKETGQKRSKIRIQAQSVQFLGGSKDGETSDAEVQAEEPLVVPEVPPAPARPAGAPKGRPAAKR
jgi:single-strand DNA-binding protein